jgi:hypothetical protein
MITKLLLTIAVIVAAVAALRGRRRAPDQAHPAPAGKGRLSWPAARVLAYGVILVIVLASAWSLGSQWRQAREIIDIQVVNPATGAVDHYQARRADIDRRGFRTLAGQEVRIADFERMIFTPPR